MKDITRNRIDWVDAAKGIGILMVIFGHNWLDEKYCFYFYAFHMPLFFVLAGYTMSEKRLPWEFVKQKAKALLIPYLLFAICNLLFYGILSATHNGNYDVYSEAIAFILQQRHTYLWFLPVLFLSEVFVYFLFQIALFKRKRSIFLGGIIMMLISIHYWVFQMGWINLIWNIDLVPMASAFILIGYLYKYHSDKFVFENNKHVLGCVFLMSQIVVMVNYINWGSVNIYFHHYGNIFLFYFGAVTATYATILLLKQIVIPRLLVILGVQSLLLYGWHRMVIEVCFIIWHRLGNIYDGSSYISLFIVLINIISVCVLILPLGQFINKRCPWLLGKF